MRGKVAPVEPALSAVVVAVPEAEPLVGDLRAALDPAATLGVPAHVTIMFPFVPPAALDDAAHATLAELFAAVPAFDARFERVAWFDEDVVWLAPEPSAPFVTMTRTLGERFGLQPYGGEHGTDVVPHLTVGHGGPVPRLRAAAAGLERGLPVRTAVRSVRLMAGSRTPGSWTTVAEYSLRS